MQRGRKSSTNVVALLRPNGDPPRLTAPSSLTRAERDLFREIVTSTDARHFIKADTPLLVSFVQATLMARRAVRGPVDTWEKACRVQMALATKLRLSPQTRIHPKIAMLRRDADGPPAVNAPWDSKYDD